MAWAVLSAASPTTRLPEMDADGLRTLLADGWDLRPASVEVVDGEIDVTAAVTLDGGERLACKVGGTRLSLQATVLEAVADADVPTPAVHRTTDDTTTLDIDGRHVLLTTWLPGRPVATLGAAPLGLLHRIGGAAARLDRSLADVDDPRLGERHDWDLRDARTVVAAHAARVADVELRTAAEEVLDRVAVHVGDALDGLPVTPTHHDLNDANLLVVDAGDEPRLSGVIDFGDVVAAPRVCEVAILGAYAMLRQPDPLAALDAVVRGFTDEVTLSDEEHRLVAPLALLRITQNAVVWAVRSQQGDNVDYAHARSKDSFPLVRHLLSRSTEPARG